MSLRRQSRKAGKIDRKVRGKIKLTRDSHSMGQSRVKGRRGVRSRREAKGTTSRSKDGEEHGREFVVRSPRAPDS
jgi:hypothetical protein